MKKLLKIIEKEIQVIFENSEPEYETDNFFLGLFYTILYGGAFFIMMCSVMLFATFIGALFYSNFNLSSCIGIFYMSLGALFISYIMKKIRIEFFDKN